MKKTEMTLFILTLLFHAPAFSMDIDETNYAPALKIKSSKKQDRPSIETKSGWYSANNKIKIKYAETQELGDFKGSKLYGFIDPSFTDSQWQMALGKGFTKTAIGTNGVKFINNSLLELKINGDERLYATEVHKNDRGDYIAIFDRQTRHKKISKIANKNKFKIHADCFSNLNNSNEEIVSCR